MALGLRSGWIRRKFGTIAVLLLVPALFLLPGNQNGRASSPTLASSGPSQLSIFRLYFVDDADLRQALGPPNAFDVLGVDLNGRFAVLLITDDDAESLRAGSYRVELDERSAGQSLLSWSAEYYTYDRMLAELTQLTANYPSIARLYDLGPTWKTTKGEAGRRVWALRIRRGDNPKPQILFDADQHAREIVTPEIAMRLAKHLLENYGRDAEATYLVDNRDVWIVPMVNPDGHVLVEGGVSLKRKNDDTDNGGCGEPYWGVDINRNFPYRWSSPGADSYPCGETYYGPSAGSEPETQALMRLIDDNSFMFLMDYHSFGNLVLWPWGYTDSGTDLDPRLAATGAKLAQLTARSGGTSYSPIQGSQLYLTSGNLLDWAYASKSVLAYTTEIGSSGDWFDPPYARVDAFWAENKPPALYLLNIADDPDRVYGPETRDARAFAGSVAPTGTIAITATISDLGNGGQNIVAAELFVDTAGANGGIAMTPVDGTFDSPSEVVQVTLSAAAIGVGRRTLLVRGQDAAGNWGSLSMTFVRVEGASAAFFPLVSKGSGGSR
ncbi:MAG: zinc carboxypeptidase [Chloroflexi bacterium]|nr:zinc carboxypeptidase [Chloroflexota bacterium]